MSPQEIFLAIFTLVSSVIIVLVVVFLGWFLIWKIFLSKFKLVREILGLANGDVVNNDKIDRTKTRKIRKE